MLLPRSDVVFAVFLQRIFNISVTVLYIFNIHIRELRHCGCRMTMMSVRYPVDIVLHRQHLTYTISGDMHSLCLMFFAVCLKMSNFAHIWLNQPINNRFAMKDICCLGHITKDKIITPRKTVYMSGGTSFYFSYAFNSLPHRVPFRLVTKLGEEDMDAVRLMRGAGIDVEVRRSRHTVYFENKYGDNQNERTQRVLEKADPFTVEDVSGLDAGIYHLGSLLADDFSPEVVEYLSQRGSISIDAQGYLRDVRGHDVHAVDWEDKLRILALTDIIKVNEHEMQVITGLSDARDAALRLAGWGVKEVVVTLGSEGSLIYADGCFHEIPAYAPREIVDATGCGDTYSAGYLYCRALGAGYSEAGRFAAAMCTLKLEHNGPFDRTAAEAEALVRGERRG